MYAHHCTTVSVAHCRIIITEVLRVMILFCQTYLVYVFTVLKAVLEVRVRHMLAVIVTECQHFVF